MSDIIYWTLVNSHQAPLENPDGFLSLSELRKLSTLRFPKRHAEWLLGRWAAKSLVKSIPACRQYSLNEIEIRNTPDGAPYIQLPGGTISPDCLSISHSGRLALCALAPGPAIRTGADLENVEPRANAFVEDYLTLAERELVNSCPVETRETAITLVWSAKESMLKALGVGLRWDTRQVEVRAITGLLPANESTGEWQKMQACDLQQESRHWEVWWQRRDSFVITLAGFATKQADIRSALLVEKHIPGGMA
ncbi:MAG: 4'-phosphopantetheinyl transferase [Anaerolineaceae bacterium]|nr:MAG: 4'-phosphopantetheinyl transferase [Anaerolineaceae bacterium]